VAKLLVVDDDAELATVIAGFLTKQSHTVDVALNGRSAFDILAVSGYDAIILDLDLPDINGMEICAQLRASKNRTPIIMLTGRSSVDDTATGLDCGADDYLTKPFSLKELSSRVKALIRRSTNVYSNVLKCADIELDPTSHRVTKAGKPIHLLPIDFALLEFFMRHPQQVFSNNALLAKVWTADTEATDDAIRSSVRRLRQQLDDGDDEGSSIIENQRRIGYRLRAEAG
jgi:DNA-binding response OmpR family regulator